MTSAAVAPATADAATTVTIGAGASFGTGTVFVDGSVSTSDYCTIAAVGKDPQGRLLALTAAHCTVETVAPYAPVDGLWAQGQKIGTIAGRYQTASAGGVTPGYYDFAFYYLDASKVTIASQRGANVSGGLPAPTYHAGTFTQVCMSGLTSGQRCGNYIGDGGTNPRTHIVGITVQPGDSGGPLYTKNGLLLGIGSRGGTGLPAAYYSDVRDAVTYAVGHGFITGFAPIG
ncbi:hypothetical protein GCM10027265_17300 [Jatrophihabitans fulvus]